MLGLDRKSELDSRERRSLGIWLRLMKCSSAIERAVGRDLRREFGQGLSRFDVLSQLQRGPQPGLTIGELSRSLLAAEGNISRLLDRMAERGLVERRPSVSDRRIQHVAITSRGRKLFARMEICHARTAHTMLGGLSSADQETLRVLLDKLRKRIDS